MIDGVTTNPSLAAKVGKPYPEIVKEILEIIGPEATISLEVIATDFEGMVEQGSKLAALDERVVVKIPCTQDGLRATRALSEKDIKVNVTLVFSPVQTLLAAKAGAFYVSPFIGRLDDVEYGAGDDVVEASLQIMDNYMFESEILYASVRDVDHVMHAAMIGADIITIPFAILEKLVEHPLTATGLNKFLEDWKESGLELPA